MTRWDSLKRSIGIAGILFIVFTGIYTMYYTVTYVPNSYSVNTTNEYNETVEMEKLHYARTDLVPVKSFNRKNTLSQWSVEAALGLFIASIIYVIFMSRKSRGDELIDEKEHKKMLTEYIRNMKGIIEFKLHDQTHLQFCQTDQNVPKAHRRWYFAELNYDGYGWRAESYSIDPYSYKIYSILHLPYMLEGDEFMKVYGDFKYRTPEGLAELQRLYGYKGRPVREE